jgi:hypothetical protein
MYGRITMAVFALAVMGACSDAVRTPTQPGNTHRQFPGQLGQP